MTIKEFANLEVGDVVAVKLNGDESVLKVVNVLHASYDMVQVKGISGTKRVMEFDRHLNRRESARWRMIPPCDCGGTDYEQATSSNAKSLITTAIGAIDGNLDQIVELMTQYRQRIEELEARVAVLESK